MKNLLEDWTGGSAGSLIPQNCLDEKVIDVGSKALLNQTEAATW